MTNVLRHCHLLAFIPRPPGILWLNSAMSRAALPNSGRASPPLVKHVLWSVTPAQTASPYIRDIVGAIEDRGWAVRFLTLKELMSSSNQVVHIQWPEHVSRGATARATALKNARSLAIVAALRLRRHTVVLTAHNRAPHGASNRVDRIFRRAVQQQARATVTLVAGHEQTLRADGAIAHGSQVVTIPHPTHAPDSPLSLAPEDERRTLVVLGQIHPYHQIEEFVAALHEACNLRPVVVVGGVGDRPLLDRLEMLAHSREWLTVRPGFASDADLVPILSNAAAIVSLQRNTFNSGGPFYALPRGLPIIINAGPQADDLAEHAGEDWVYPVPADVSTLDFNDFESWLNRPRSAMDLSHYEVGAIADRHIELYELLRSPGPQVEF